MTSRTGAEKVDFSPGQNLQHAMYRAALLAMLLLAPAQARLTEVRVWYYPPAGQPALIKHWVPGGLKVDRKYAYSRLGRFRIRVTCSESERVGILFTDDTGATFDLPDRDRPAQGGVKDVFWLIPYNFLTGPARLQVRAGNDQTEVMALGSVSHR